MVGKEPSLLKIYPVVDNVDFDQKQVDFHLLIPEHKEPLMLDLNVLQNEIRKGLGIGDDTGWEYTLHVYEDEED